MRSVFQMVFDPVHHEPDVPGDGQCPRDLQVVLLGNHDTLIALSGFEQGFMYAPAHVALDLADDGVAGPSPLQFDDEETGPVLADGKDVHGPGAGRVLPANRLAVLLVEVVFPA